MHQIVVPAVNRHSADPAGGDGRRTSIFSKTVGFGKAGRSRNSARFVQHIAAGNGTAVVVGDGHIVGSIATQPGDERVGLPARVGGPVVAVGFDTAGHTCGDLSVGIAATGRFEGPET